MVFKKGDMQRVNEWLMACGEELGWKTEDCSEAIEFPGYERKGDA